LKGFFVVALPQTQISDQNPSNALGIIFGRFMLPDMTEHPCQVADITNTGATFSSAKIPPEGHAIVAYLEEVGRIEAISGPATTGGFAIYFTLKGARLERLQQRIEWLQNRGSGAEDNRRHARFEPEEKASQIALLDGRVYECEVLDISVSGAAVKTDVMPSVGTSLMLGKMRGRVVRYIEQGIAIEFVKQLDRSSMPVLSGPSPL
jgi:PilZ domain